MTKIYYHMALFALVVMMIIMRPLVGVASDGIPDLSDFFTSHIYSKYTKIKYVNYGKAEKVILLNSTVTSNPVRVMIISQNNTCFANLQNNDGMGSGLFKCKNGAEISASYVCERSGCIINGNHSQKGGYSFDFRYRGKELTLQDVYSFVGSDGSSTESSQTQAKEREVKTNKIVSTSSATTLSKLDEIKLTCKELGFTIGTEKHGECVLKLME